MIKKIAAVTFVTFCFSNIALAQYWPDTREIKAATNNELQLKRVDDAKRNSDFQNKINRHERNFKNPEFFGKTANKRKPSVEKSYTLEDIIEITAKDLMVITLETPFLIGDLERDASSSKDGNPYGSMMQKAQANNLKMVMAEFAPLYESKKYVKSDRESAIKVYSLAKIMRLYSDEKDADKLVETTKRLIKIIK